MPPIILRRQLFKQGGFLPMIPWILAMQAFLLPTDIKLNQSVPSMCSCSIRSKQTQGNIDKMLQVANEETGKGEKKVLVGLAAPQIGIPQRIIIIDMAATGEANNTPNFKEFINPEILWRSDSMNFYREGCFSTGPLCGIVPRSDQVLVRAHDRNGKVFTEELVGYTARIAQHEIDHLDGIRFPDRVDNDQHLHRVEERETAEYRSKWQEWTKVFPRSEWEKMKQ